MPDSTETDIDGRPDPVVIRAAGGLVWSGDGANRRLAVIHRPKHRDWSFPKGKLEEGESWQQAAVREVREETGCTVRVTGFAGPVCYMVRGRPKIVLFWHMEKLAESGSALSNEVDQLEWLTWSEAMTRLNHPGERKLLNENRHR